MRITIKFTPVGSNTPENWREAEGTDLKDFLQGAGVNTTKVAVYHNGNLVQTSQLCTVELQDGDSVKVVAQNYSSGATASAKPLSV